jgi:hypothetical protein
MVLTSKGGEFVWTLSASSVSSTSEHLHSLCTLTFLLSVICRNEFFRCNQPLHGHEMALSSSVVAVSTLRHCVVIALINDSFQGIDKTSGPDSTRKRRSKVHSQRSCICSFEVKLQAATIFVVSSPLLLLCFSFKWTLASPR